MLYDIGPVAAISSRYFARDPDQAALLRKTKIRATGKAAAGAARYLAPVDVMGRGEHQDEHEIPTSGQD